MSLNYIDLFCGAGGLSLGFDRAGFSNVFSVEFNKNFAKTYMHNFPNHNLLIEDIKCIDNKKIMQIIDNREVDVIIGGPPCQGFSIAGNIGRNFLEDERNELFNEFVRVVSIVKPKMFVMENVAALERHNKGKTLQLIIKSFESKGYKVEGKVLNSVDYDIAQERRRIVIIGVLKYIKCEISYPDKKGRKICIEKAIGDLPVLSSGGKSIISNHIAMNHSTQMLKKMSYVRDGGNRFDIPEDLRPKSGDIRKYIRYNSKVPSICITGDMRKVFHYSQNRALTARELARIQSFPDDFVFLGSSIQIQQQIGNAVPPKLAFEIANKIKETLENAEVS